MRNLGSDFILNRMMALHPKVIDLTLERVWSLLEALGNPQNNLPKVIHIAGTNGKGSTLSMLRAGLNEIGLKTLPENKRGAHFLSATLPKGAPIDFLTRLERKGIYISERGGNLRITPHLWNKQQDFDYFLSEVSSLL